LNHQGVDVNERSLDEMKSQKSCFLVFLPVGGQFPSIAVKDEAVGVVPTLHDIEPGVNFAAEVLGCKILAKEDCFDCPPEFRKCFVSGMLGIVPGKAPEEALRVGHVKFQGHHMLHQGIKVFLNKFPVDYLRHHHFQVWENLVEFSFVELLAADPFQPRHQLEPQHAAKGEGHSVLPMSVYILTIHCHLWTVTENPIDHGPYFRRGNPLELGVNAKSLSFDMPVNHHARPIVANMPLSKEVLIPCAELLGIGRTGGSHLAPDIGVNPTILSPDANNFKKPLRL